MDSEKFLILSKSVKQNIERYINDRAPAMVIQKTLRFIDGNFRAQGWQGDSFRPWKPTQKRGTILVNRALLRRSFNYNSAGAGAVRFYSNMPYAEIHNRGGTINKSISVGTFTRRRFLTNEVSAPRARTVKYQKSQTGESIVRAHTRRMNIVMPQRQFAPYEGHESKVLNQSITREIERDINKILTLK